ncbi:hypothetical protein [Kitasatospora sp. NE20-6]|uniref:hypothetical protein n=1 Tax=Kitasatospora sp. NE20-6 TaxID=2859066 RepID=UPI0038B2F5F1
MDMKEFFTPSRGIAHAGFLATCVLSTILWFVAGPVAAAWVAGLFGAAFTVSAVVNLLRGRGFGAAFGSAYLHTFGIWEWFSGW